jgi:ABC-type multidrug transport system fused ATPase/permease subunit
MRRQPSAVTAANVTLPALRASLGRRPVTLGVAVLLGIASAAASLLVPLIVRNIVVNIGAHRSVLASALELAALTLAGGFASGWSSFLLGRAGERGIADVRTRIINHVLRMGLYDTRAAGPGDLVARVTVDSAQLRSITDVSVTALPVSMLVVAVSLVVMGFLNWILLLIVIVTFGLASLAIRAFLRGMRRGASARQAALGSLGERFSSALGSLTMLKAYRAEPAAADLVGREAWKAADAAISADRAQAFIAPLMGLGQQVAIIGVLTGSGVLIASGRLSPADFVAFLMYLFQLISPLMLVASAFGRIQLGMAAVGRIDSLFDLPLEDQGPEAEPELVQTAHVLEFDQVSAGYNGTDALREVSMRVPARGLTALVGVSGAGKSTIINLAERFLAPRSGRATFRGHDLGDWPLGALRGRLAYVDQSVTLVDGTVRDNLLLGCENPPSDDTLLDVLRQVDLAESITQLPMGLETRVGGSSDLSGGQRQRLALARAMLSSAEVFLLDEPTSQLDGINEQRLVEIIEKLQEDRAVVVAAHRLSTVRNADHIVYLENGMVAGQGSHEHLLRTCEGYRKLVLAQADSTDARGTRHLELPGAVMNQSAS